MVHFGRAAERLVPDSFSDVSVNAPEAYVKRLTRELSVPPTTEFVPFFDPEQFRSQQLESIRAEVDAAFENTVGGDNL